jgi:hypothetical protein
MQDDGLLEKIMLSATVQGQYLTIDNIFDPPSLSLDTKPLKTIIFYPKNINAFRRKDDMSSSDKVTKDV